MTRFRMCGRALAYSLLALALGTAVVGCGGSQAKDKSSADGAKQEDLDSLPPLVRGSRVSLWIPGDVLRFSRVYAFRRAEPLLFVMVSEMTAANEEDEDALLRGIIDGSERFGEPRVGKRGAAKEIQMEGEVNGNKAQSLVLAQDGALATVLVAYAPESREDAERVLASVRLNPRVDMDPLSVHGLALDLAGELAVWNMTQQPIMLRDPNQPIPMPVAAPFAFVTVLLHGQGDEIAGETLGGLLASTMSNLEIDPASARTSVVEIGAHGANEIFANGKKDGEPIAVYGYILNDGDAAIAAVGHVGLGQAEAQMPDVVSTLRSLRLSDYSTVTPLPSGNEP